MEGHLTYNYKVYIVYTGGYYVRGQTLKHIVKPCTYLYGYI